MHKYKINEQLTLAINNEMTSEIFSVSYYMLSGMKNDVRYINGTVHLAEHLLARSLFYADNPFIYTNAFVDKEYTCFYGQAFSPYFEQLIGKFKNIFSSLEIDTKHINYEKSVIMHEENRKILSNSRLLDLEKLEYVVFGEDIGLQMPTFVSPDSFFKINESMVRNYIFNELAESKQYMIISGKFSKENVDKVVKIIDAHYWKRQYWNHYDLYQDEELTKLRAKNIIQIENYTPKHFMTAILLNKIDTIKEWFMINIICVFYKTYINKAIQKSRNCLNELFVKQYENACLLIFYFSSDFKGTISLLRSIESDYFAQLLVSMKRTFLFPFLEKMSNYLKYHKVQFMSMCFNQTDDIFQLSKLKDIINSITCEDIIEIHKKCVNGRYYSVT